MKKYICVVLFALLICISCTVILGCGAGTTTIDTTTDPNGDEEVQEGSNTVDYSTDSAKSVELPADYPEDSFPIFNDAYIMTVHRLDDSFTVVAFCKEPVQDVVVFYKEFFKDTQAFSMEQGDEYSIIGTKDNYSYTIVVMESEEIEGYPTSLGINLMPTP